MTIAFAAIGAALITLVVTLLVQLLVRRRTHSDEGLTEAIRELVLDDQRLRNDICWSAFDC